MLDELEPERGADDIKNNIIDFLELLQKETQDCIPAFRESIDGFVARIWIDEYIQTRIEAMHKAFEDISVRFDEPSRYP